MSKDIILPYFIGETKKEVIITFPSGTSGGAHIMIDNYYHGKVVKTSEGWRVYLNGNSWLSPEDEEVILEAVRKQLG